MVTVICIDGLAGHPETTFNSLKRYLMVYGYNVLVPNIDETNVITHSDRVSLVLNEYKKHNKIESDFIFLVGQSAGGSAVRIAAEKIEKEGLKVTGVILLSPAMPRGIFFMTKCLFKVMKKRLLDLFLGRVIKTTESEYSSLVEPVQRDIKDSIKNRRPIQGIEGRELAFFPPKFIGYSFPTLHIFGSSDNWISPKAQKNFQTLLSKKGKVFSKEIDGVGHLVLSSNKKEEVELMIQKWIESLSG